MHRQLIRPQGIVIVKQMSIKENIKIKKPLDQYQTYSSNQPDTAYWYVFFPQKKYVRLRKSFFMEVGYPRKIGQKLRKAFVISETTSSTVFLLVWDKRMK